MSNYHVNFRENPIEPPDPEQESVLNEAGDKLKAGDITAASTLLRKLDNFWYHNKWTVIVVTFFVSVAIVCLVQFISRPEYDSSLVFGSTYRMNKEERADLEKLLIRICPEDFTGDDEKLINIMEYQVYSEEEYDSEREYYSSITNEEGETDSFQINRQYNTSEYTNFSQYTMTGESSVYILSPYLYGILLQADRLKPLSEIYAGEELPEGAMADGFGVALKDTDFYKYNPEAQVLPENSIICFHLPTVGGRSKNPELYADDMAFFKAILDFEVKE